MKILRREIILSLVIVIVFLTFSGCATTGGTGKPISKISIEDYLNKYSFNSLAKIDEGKLPKYVLAIIGDATEIKEANLDLGQLLQDEINKIGRVTIIDRNNMDKIIAEQKLALSGLTEESGIEIGQILGADFLILSSIISNSQQKVDKLAYDSMEIKVTVQVKLLNVNTSEVFMSLNGDGETSAKLITDSSGELITGAVDFNNLYAEATMNAVTSIVPQFISAFPAIGFILKIEGDLIQSDIGGRSGVIEESRVAVIRKGEPNIHPVTEELVSYNIEYLGYGVVSSVHGETCKIKIVETMDNITNRDLIVLIEN
jgi:hypothetical protein